jgi:hypothetical protein
MDYTHDGWEEVTIDHLSTLAGQGLPCPARCLDRDSTSSNPMTSLMHLTCWNMAYIGHKLNTGDLLDDQLMIPTRTQNNTQENRNILQCIIEEYLSVIVSKLGG